MSERIPGTDHPNLAVARGLWQAVADGDPEAIRDILDDDVVWNTIGRNPLAGLRQGPDGVIEYLAEVGETADELRSRLEGVYVNDDGAVVRYHASARRGVRRLEMDYLVVLQIEAGKITRSVMIAMDQARNDEFWN